VYSVALRDDVRTWVLIQGKSQRAAAHYFGLSRNTVAKLLEEEPAPKERRYQRQAEQKTPVRDAALPHIEKWLKENEWLSRWAPKQCWTAHRMWGELRKLGILIGESTVRMYVQEKQQTTKSAFVPLDFGPGERAEFDFGEATVKLKGQLVKISYLAGRLRFCGAMFVECFPTQRQEAFLLGQQHAFEFWGGVPRVVVYDNLKPAVLQVLQGHSRREHEVLLIFIVSIALRLFLPMWHQAGRKEASKIWSGMLDEIISCRFQKDLIWKPSMQNSERIVSWINSALWLDAQNLFSHAWHLNGVSSAHYLHMHRIWGQ